MKLGLDLHSQGARASVHQLLRKQRGSPWGIRHVHRGTSQGWLYHLSVLTL
jgi:hypothetical protein